MDEFERKIKTTKIMKNIFVHPLNFWFALEIKSTKKCNNSFFFRFENNINFNKPAVINVSTQLDRTKIKIIKKIIQSCTIKIIFDGARNMNLEHDIEMNMQSNKNITWIYLFLFYWKMNVFQLQSSFFL